MITGNVLNQFDCPINCECAIPNSVILAFDIEYDGVNQNELDLIGLELGINTLAGDVDVCDTLNIGPIFSAVGPFVGPTQLDVINEINNWLVDIVGQLNINIPNANANAVYDLVTNVVTIQLDLNAVLAVNPDFEECCGQDTGAVLNNPNAGVNIVNAPIACCRAPQITFTNTEDINETITIPLIDDDGEYMVDCDDMDYTGEPILITIEGCEGEILYQNEITFPPAATGAQRVWEDLNFRVFQCCDIEDTCNDPPIPAEDAPETLCSFYVIKEPCSKRVCLYNTQGSIFTNIYYDLGDGTLYTGINVCHDYIPYGTFCITQIITNQGAQLQPQCCGFPAVEIPQEIIACETTICGVDVLPYLPSGTINIQPNNECCDDCDPTYCVELSDSATFTGNITFNDDYGCCQIQCPDGEEVCEPVDEFCNNGLNIQSYIIQDPATQVSLPVDNPNAGDPPEYFYFPSPQRNWHGIGTGPFSFEFWAIIDDYGIPTDPAGNDLTAAVAPLIPYQEERVIMSWQAELLADGSSLNQGPELDTVDPNTGLDNQINMYLTLFDPQVAPAPPFPRLRFRMERPALAQGIDIYSAVLPPAFFNALNHISIVKGSANPNDWRIFINGVDQTDQAFPAPPVPFDPIPPQFQDLNNTTGGIAFGVMWGQNTQNRPNAYQVDPVNQGAVQAGIMYNNGNITVTNFRLWNVPLTNAQVLEHFNNGCAAFPSAQPNQNIRLFHRINQPSQLINTSVIGPDPTMFNYQPVRLLEEVTEPPIPPNQNPAWLDTCCGRFIWEITSLEEAPEDTPNPVYRTYDDNTTVFSFFNPGEYEVSLRVSNCCDESIIRRRVVASPDIFVQRVNCLQFQLRDTFSYQPPVNISVSIYNLQNEIISSFTSENYTGNEQFLVTLPDDGVYVVVYEAFLATDPTILINRKRLVLYDFCNIITCYKKMLMDISCESCTPTCTDTSEIQAERKKMYQINKLFVLISAFLTNLTIYSGSTAGNFYFEPKYIDFLNETNKLIEKIKVQCGQCNYLSLQERRSEVKCHIEPSCGCN